MAKIARPDQTDVMSASGTVKVIPLGDFDNTYLIFRWHTFIQYPVLALI